MSGEVNDVFLMNAGWILGHQPDRTRWVVRAVIPDGLPTDH